MRMITPDRDKVIRGLVCIAGYNHLQSNPCAVCDYQNSATYAVCVHRIAVDALDLLNEQEPQSVIVKCEPSNGNILWFADCPKCGQGIERDKHKNHCGYCGQAVKWNDD